VGRRRVCHTLTHDSESAETAIAAPAEQFRWSEASLFQILMNDLDEF
jgi:hypothetical protein